MKALSFKEPWVRSHVERLLGLGNTTRKAIIRALERSLENPGPKRGDGLSERFWSMYGAWDSSESAEELARSIRESRYDRDRPVDL